MSCFLWLWPSLLGLCPAGDEVLGVSICWDFTGDGAEEPLMKAMVVQVCDKYEDDWNFINTTNAFDVFCIGIQTQ